MAIKDIVDPPVVLDQMPDPVALLDKTIAAPEISEQLNIFPIEWKVNTPSLLDIYEASRDPGWSPNTLPWDTFDASTLTQDQRYAIAYWWSLLSVALPPVPRYLPAR